MGELIIGTHTYGNPIRRGDMNTIHIGKFCSIAEGVVFDSGFNHNAKFVSTFPFNSRWPGCELIEGHPICKGDITIGNDVWICEHVLIMSGITIGDGAVIGAHSIVTKDVAPYSIVAGAPAREIKKRFSPEIIEQLLKIRWWDWPDEKILEFTPLLMNEDIRLFIHEAEKSGG